MKNTIVFIIIALLSAGVYAQDNGLRVRQNGRQVRGGNNPGEQPMQQQSVIDNRPKPPITDYQIISVTGDTTHVDTTLTIHKDYAHNYLRKDNFGLLPFSNVGQAYTSLTPDFNKVSLMPLFGARATHAAYLDVDDIHYYHVPTPWTRLFFKTTFKRGQNLDAFFTSNISPQFNFFIAYKGLRSFGKYEHVMTSQGSFRTGFDYKSKSDRYHLRAHFVSQRLSAQQNGGLTDLANRQFASADGQFNNRMMLATKYKDAKDKLLTKRFYVNQYYALFQGADSTANNQIRLGHILNFTDKEYSFDQETAFPLYGLAYQNNGLRDLTEFQSITNTLYAQYQNQTLGKLLFKIRNAHYNYGYQRKLYLDNAVVPNRLKGDVFAVGASYENQIGGFEISGDAMLNFSGDFEGHYLTAQAGYAIDSLNRVEAGITLNAHRPNYNFILYQSEYKNYNWYNDFDNVQRQSLYVHVKSAEIADIEASYTRIHNYTYFGLRNNTTASSEADSLVTPYQYGGDINYVKIKAHRKFDLWRFSLDNTMMYQQVLDGDEVMHVSPFVTRHSLYYRDYWFHHNLYLQVGFTYNYFSSYYADAYDPVLAEFYVQDFDKLDGFSRLDFFFNAKVRKTRIFFKLENLTTLLDGNGHYAAPYQPYRDFVIRFGIVWDFFL